MDIVDVVRTTKSSRIYIPAYHHGPLFMKPDSKFTGILLLDSDSEHVKQQDEDGVGLKLASQILISPYPFSEWENLWKIAFTIEDHKGILHEIAKSLKSAYVNILTEVSRPVYMSQYQSVEMVVSTSQLADRLDLNELQTMQRIKEAIIVKYLKELHIEQIDWMAASPIMMDRIDRYQAVSKRLKHDNTDLDLLNTANLPKEIIIEIDEDEAKLFFKVPKEWYPALKDRYGQESDGAITYLIHTNSSHQLMSLYFPEKAKKLWNIRIECLDIKGAIATFTKILSDKHISLVSSNLYKIADSRSRLDLVCEFTSPQESDMVEVIKEAFDMTAKIVSRFRPILSTIHSLETQEDSDKSQWTKIKEWEEPEDSRIDRVNNDEERPSPVMLPRPEGDKIRQEDLAQAFTQLWDDRFDSTVKEAISPEDRLMLDQKIDIAHDLLLTGLLAKRKIFVSYQYLDNGDPDKIEIHNHLTKLVRGVLEKANFCVVEGRDNPSHVGGLLVEDIMKKIDDSPYFIAILTPDPRKKAHGKDGKVAPSDWTLWEYGYAMNKRHKKAILFQQNTSIPGLLQPLKMFEFPKPNSVDAEDDKAIFEKIEQDLREIIMEFLTGSPIA